MLGAPRGVTVELSSPGEWCWSADEDLLRRMTLNLVDNAVRHSPGGGVVQLATSSGERAPTRHGGRPGAGIPPEAHARVFERFYRTDEARARDGAGADGVGAGLGLAIARWVAEAHGGRLELVALFARGGDRLHGHLSSSTRMTRA